MPLQNSYIIVLVLFFSVCTFAAKFEEHQVTFKTVDSIVLSGTISVPETQNKSKKFPVVLLIPGSGPTDRDGNQPPSLVTDLLKQIAHHLAANGIASFRFDKRAAHTNKMQWPKDFQQLPKFFSWRYHQLDIKAAFDKLASSKNIDSQRLAILGHSEGGLLALAQAKSLSAKALVLIGTPGRTFGVLITEQISALLDQQNASPEIKSEYLTKNASIQKYISEKGKVPTNVPQGLKALYPPSASSYLKEVLNLDPIPLTRNFKGPALVINGEFDKQVSPSRDANLLFDSFQKRKSSIQNIFIAPSLSHNLKKVSNSADIGLTGAVDPKTLSVLAEWLSKNL
jgi:acetyl esterase/lipase